MTASWDRSYTIDVLASYATPDAAIRALPRLAADAIDSPLRWLTALRVECRDDQRSRVLLIAKRDGYGQWSSFEWTPSVLP